MAHETDQGDGVTRDLDAQPTGRRRRGVAIVMALVVALYAAALALIGIGDAVSALADASAVWLVAALVPAATGVVALSLVQRASAAALGHRLHLAEALNVSMTAFTLGQSVPGGGATAGAIAVQRLTRFGLGGPVATASFALSATFAAATIALIGAVGVGAAVGRGEIAPAFLAAAAGVLVVVLAMVGVVLTVIRSPRLGDRVVRGISRLHPRLGDRCERWLANFAGVTGNPPRAGQLASVVCWSSVKWLSDLAALGLVFAAFGESVTVTVVVVGFVVSQLAAAIPITPGGVGFVESGMLSVFVGLGVALPIATVVVVTYRVIVTWLPTLAGVPGLVRPPSARDVPPRRGPAE